MANFFILASMPEHFEDVDQRFGYDMRISQLFTGIEDIKPYASRKVIGIYDLLGRPMLEEASGVQLIQYDDGSFRKVHRSAFSY